MPMEKDTILSGIFPEQQHGSTDPIATGDQLDKTSQQITTSTKQLNVPAVSARQKEEIANHGSADLRERSEAYCALLARRPNLGSKYHLTAERFQAVIAKDRRYDALVVNVEEARTLVRVGIATVEARLTEDVGTVLVFVDDRIAQTGDPKLQDWFRPAGVRLDALALKEADKQQRDTQNQHPKLGKIADVQHQTQVLPEINRMQQGALAGADLNGPVPPGAAKSKSKKKTAH